MGYKDSLAAEAASWVSPDTSLDDKLLRERIRHPAIVRALLLDRLPTHRFTILEVGGGPLPVSDLIPFRHRTVVDPCSDDYRKIAPCPDHITAEIETAVRDHKVSPFGYDLVISTNSLDHVQDWERALREMSSVVKQGGFIAVLCCENNALTHPHPAHKINLTVADIHRVVDFHYETIHELTYAKDRFRYGWRRFDGACGQPAFAWLGRKAYSE